MSEFKVPSDEDPIVHDIYSKLDKLTPEEIDAILEQLINELTNGGESDELISRREIRRSVSAFKIQ